MNRIPILLAALCFFLLFIPAESRAQGNAPENLQVLPETMSSRDVRMYMRNFTEALGVRCDFCHVEVEVEGQRPRTNFASDDKEHKRTARAMMRMVQTINQDLLSAIVDNPVQVTCVTCHRGNTKPVMIQDELYMVIQDDGARAAAERYRELRARHLGGMAYDFTEGPLNNLGYRLLSEERFDDAIVIFRLNTEMNPESSRAYDALAEGYMRSGDTQRAITFFRKSLELNPDSRNAAEQLEKLSAQ